MGTWEHERIHVVDLSHECPEDVVVYVLIGGVEQPRLIDTPAASGHQSG